VGVALHYLRFGPKTVHDGEVEKRP